MGKIIKMEQNLSLLADKMVNMDTKISQVDEAFKQFDSIDSKIKLSEEATKKITNIEAEVTRLQSMEGCLAMDNIRLMQLEGKLSSATLDPGLVETLKKEIKQDLRQEMDIIKTDITDKVDRAGTELNCLAQMIIDMKAAIKINERMLAELHPQMVKEYQQLHKA